MIMSIYRSMPIPITVLWTLIWSRSIVLYGKEDLGTGDYFDLYKEKRPKIKELRKVEKMGKEAKAVSKEMLSAQNRATLLGGKAFGKDAA